jgi:hypothetical protein
MMTSRIEADFNRRWVDANPELFAKAILKMLETHPMTEWSYRITPAYMPGMTFQVVANRKQEV